jgi:alanyl-tRNA synthetase
VFVYLSFQCNFFFCLLLYQIAPTLPFLCIIPEKSQNKITCTAFVPQNINDGKPLSAKLWIEDVFEEFDGKCGGKESLAQGSLTLTENQNYKDINNRLQDKAKGKMQNSISH